MKVYLDQNAITSLKNGEHIKLINELIYEKEAFTCYWSIAHFEDLLRNYKTELEVTDYDKKDMLFLGRISNNKFIDENLQVKCLDPANEVANYFKIYKKLRRLNKKSIEMFRELLSELDPNGKMKDMKLPQDFAESMNLSNKNNHESIMSLTKQFTAVGEPFKGYLDYRRERIKEIKAPFDPTKSVTPIDQYSKVFEKLNASISFRNLLQGKVTANKHLDFGSKYIILDLLGFKKDKKVKNLLTDSNHAYFATISDYLVTNDKNLIEKANILYEVLNYKVRAINIEDFVNKFVLRE